MTEREIARKTNIAWAINTKKDFCKVGRNVIPFDIVCDLSKATSYSKNVTANSKEALTVDHVIPGMVGNAGSGIESGVSGLAGTVVLTNGSPTVTVNDKSAVRHGDDCKMNCDAAKKSNVPGKIYTSAPLARLASQAYNIDNPVLSQIARANLLVEQYKQQAKDEFIRGTEHFFKSTKDSLVTLSDATGITGTSAESQAARGRMQAGAEALGTLLGPPPEMVQGAYMSGNAQYIAQVEQMQRNQQAAWGQVGNSISTSWNDAYARSGPVGAATMVFTGIGWNVAAGAATGVGVGMAARIAVNVGGKVLQVSAGVGRTIAEVMAASKTQAQAVKALEEAITAAKAAGASVDDIAALTAAKDAVLKGPPAPAKPAGASAAKGTVVTTTKKPAFSGDWKNYETNGLKVDPKSTPEGRRLIIELEKKGLDTNEAVRQAETLMASGSSPPLANPIEVGDKLYKIVPEGGSVGSNSAFWATEQEMAALKGMSYDQIAGRLGLPLASQQGATFEVMTMSAQRPGISFTSVIAPTTEVGAGGAMWTQPGGGLQTLIVDRSIFTTPVRTGTKFP
jgi:enamine deaminase RidA (YjgF/YER057c/UK114 family)